MFGGASAFNHPICWLFDEVCLGLDGTKIGHKGVLVDGVCVDSSSRENSVDTGIVAVFLVLVAVGVKLVQRRASNHDNSARTDL
jgi:hypothetical protein